MACDEFKEMVHNKNLKKHVKVHKGRIAPVASEIVQVFCSFLGKSPEERMKLWNPKQRIRLIVELEEVQRSFIKEIVGKNWKENFVRKSEECFEKEKTQK